MRIGVYYSRLLYGNEKLGKKKKTSPAMELARYNYKTAEHLEFYGRALAQIHFASI